MTPENLDKTQQLAAQLASWNSRIVQVAAIKGLNEEQKEELDLIFTFDPEPQSDTTGFFWIASLLTRMEFEALDERLGICQSINMGFKIGEDIFLPNGKILDTLGDHIVLWPDHAE